jgi:hypothetical protein
MHCSRGSDRPAWTFGSGFEYLGSSFSRSLLNFSPHNTSLSNNTSIDNFSESSSLPKSSYPTKSCRRLTIFLNSNSGCQSIYEEENCHSDRSFSTGDTRQNLVVMNVCILYHDDKKTALPKPIPTAVVCCCNSNNNSQ